MFLRIGTIRFPSQDKMDAYIAMLQTVFFKKSVGIYLIVTHIKISCEVCYAWFKKKFAFLGQIPPNLGQGPGQLFGNFQMPITLSCSTFNPSCVYSLWPAPSPLSNGVAQLHKSGK